MTRVELNQSKNKTTPKLYLLTNDDPFHTLYPKLEIALATKAISLLQVRRKTTAKYSALNMPVSTNKYSKSLCQEIEQLCLLADKHDCKVIINDDMKLAHKFGVGVHLGQSDGSVSEARALLGHQAIIGQTCHDSIAMVEGASNEGASYGAMGAVFASSTKPNAHIVSLDTLQKGAEKCHELGMSFCVIGGITAQNITHIRHVSMDYIAVVNDILGNNVDQIEARCVQWQTAITYL